MVDFSQAEMNALAEVFPASKVILCDFHREKAWVEWVRKGANGVSHDQETVLGLLRGVAGAATQEELDRSLIELQESSFWKENERLRNYMSNIWLPMKDRWVHMLRSRDLKVSVYTNNGVERQNETLKHTFLQGYRRCSLSELATVLVQNFVPSIFRKSNRYSQLNIQACSSYRQYDTKIPPFLRNRPKGFVQHVMSRFDGAVVYEMEDVVQLGHTFKVKSETERGKVQTVSFGYDNTMPSCTCHDWARYLLPCKHFCAVFRLVPDWGWEALPSAYKDNPLFSIDQSCVGQSQEKEVEEEVEVNEEVQEEMGEEVELPYVSLEEKKTTRSKRDLMRRACGSVLREIIENTYHLQDVEYLQDLNDQLKGILEDVQAHTPHEGTLRLAATPQKKKARFSPPDEARLVDLPVTSVPQKHPYTKRVGSRAEIMRANFRVKLDLEDSTVCNPGLVDLTTEDSLEVRNTNTWVRIGERELTEREKESLQQGEWLSDQHINFAQDLLKNEYPHLAHGFGDTLLLAHEHHSAPATSECIQIHHAERHWVLSTTIGGTVTVYDSLPCHSVSVTLGKQIVNLYKGYAVEDGTIPIKVVCAQKQQGSNDCGLFAIANAVALAQGISPTDVWFEQDKMRQHLENCFSTQTITMFPHRPQSRA
ncbi:uncharacterized protein LOC144924097 [Branchiostoma floridae x Branchiostoma belcheri]